MFVVVGCCCWLLVVFVVSWGWVFGWVGGVVRLLLGVCIGFVWVLIGGVVFSVCCCGFCVVVCVFCWGFGVV